MEKYLEIAGVPVSPLNMERACEEVREHISRGKGGYFIFRDMNGIVAANNDPTLRLAHVNAGFVAPDGMPLVWLARRYGFSDVSRVYGPDFLLEFCRQTLNSGYRHFFFGSSDYVATKLMSELRRRFPGLEICGYYAPPFRPLEDCVYLDDVEPIRAARPDIVWIGLGTPKQELWMKNHAAQLPSSVLLGVGAAFDFHSKVKRQAPLWMQRNGLEWLFRLATEPRRLGKRYLLGIPRFLMLLVTQGCRVKTYPPPAVG